MNRLSCHSKHYYLKLISNSVIIWFSCDNFMATTACQRKIHPNIFYVELLSLIINETLKTHCCMITIAVIIRKFLKFVHVILIVFNSICLIYYEFQHITKELIHCFFILMLELPVTLHTVIWSVESAEYASESGTENQCFPFCTFTS